ncbi:fungal specific transcription factor domain-containing protein [Aspergillus affinis]|uniref:fungal specific transcription factor domain-containing protein n=1 Tax=Aspergillus affinis TaxID=1070780 RepID=UPI0022FDF5B6|nr:putative C6 finger domain protein [Aspergillus affinis]KAI9036663.1 putative C6 finger domain protein [Aspergillus affinis]
MAGEPVEYEIRVRAIRIAAKSIVAKTERREWESLLRGWGKDSFIARSQQPPRGHLFVRGPITRPRQQQCPTSLAFTNNFTSTCDLQLGSTEGSKGDEKLYRVRSQRLPSRYRIAQLESKVANLTKFVHDAEIKSGDRSTSLTELATEPTVDSDDLDRDSIGSDFDAIDQPVHLRSLFQNDWLSVNPQRHNGHSHDRRMKVFAHLHDRARRALQRLIPPKADVLTIANSASQWLPLVYSLFPQPGAIKSQQELGECFEDMNRPDTDPISLASWLLTVALTGQQIQGEDNDRKSQLQKSHEWSKFCRAVSDTVETTIIPHDRLVSTISGLSMAMHFFRLQIGQGNFRKAWVRLRHVVAIAEIMGLPKASQVIQNGRVIGTEGNEAQHQQAQLWDSIISANGLLGMIINLPPDTRRHPQAKMQALIVDGVVQPRVYLRRLTDIAAKVQHLDDLNLTPDSGSEFYSSTLALIGELKSLASQPPEEWWAPDEGPEVKPDHIVQFIHNSVMVRTHLPFIMRQDVGEEYVYSRLVCMNACESAARLYQFLRGTLSPGIFCARILDLQVFVTTVVLLLISHSSSSSDRWSFPADKAKTASTVQEVTKLMIERSHDTPGSHFAHSCVTTIDSLHRLLQQDSPSHLQDLTLQVPLLGKVKVRRNFRQQEMSMDSNVSRVETDPNAWRPEEPSVSQPQSLSKLNSSSQPPRNWAWDFLSWSVEDNSDSYFQDALMMDDFDPFTMWPDTYNDFSLIG